MKRLKIGIFGVGPRGFDIAKSFTLLGCDIVALCDERAQILADASLNLGGIPTFTDFDEFIKLDTDAVILTNFFHEHAPYAIKCFERGIHVYSECISNGTMAEGVALIRAYEKSKSIYFLAENYPEMKFNREMKRICDSGTLGKILFAEGEYNHPSDPYNKNFKKSHNYTLKHWRNFLPRTYYITHSLGPIMRATGATPIRVSAFAAFAPIDKGAPTFSYVGDRAAVIMTQNDDGSIFRVSACSAFGAHENSYRICGTEGQIENVRGMGEKVMLRYNEWSKPEGAAIESLYEPEWSDKDEELIKASGHGGSDFLTVRAFINCIREGKEPEHPYNIHAAVTMASVAILSHRSVLEGGKSFEIPDFHLEENRRLYESDTLTPFWSKDGTPPTIPCCSHPDYSPTDEQIKNAKRF